MSAQTKYGYSTPIGAAGGIVDVAPHQIDTFLNEEENGVLKFGAGVVQGSKPGVNIALPKKAATAAKFEGITTNNRTTEYDLEASSPFVRVLPLASCATARFTAAWLRASSLPTVTAFT